MSLNPAPILFTTELRPASDPRSGSEARCAGSYSRPLHPEDMDRSVSSGSQVRSSLAYVSLSESQSCRFIWFIDGQTGQIMTNPASLLPSSYSCPALDTSSGFFFNSRIWGSEDCSFHSGPIFYVCSSARNWVSFMYKGIYHIRNSLWQVATLDVWSS